MTTKLTGVTAGVLLAIVQPLQPGSTGVFLPL